MAHMKYVRIALFFLAAFWSTVFAAEPVKYISTSAALAKYGTLISGKTFLAYPELKEDPIRWFDSIPEMNFQFFEKSKEFEMVARPGSYHSYQIGVWAARKGLTDVQLVFSELVDEKGRSIEVSRMTCFNAEGIDFKGKTFAKKINVEAGRVQALWIGIDLDQVRVGSYSGSMIISTQGEEQRIPLVLKVVGEPVVDHGFGEGKSMARLHWLNSTIGIDEKLTRGYLPVSVQKNRIRILGRRLDLAENGLPASIISYFDASNQSLLDAGVAVIEAPFQFRIEKENGTVVQLVPGELTFTENTPARVVWRVVSSSEEFELECNGQMEFDGFVDYRLLLTARLPVKVKDVSMLIPVENDRAEYMMGLGHEGGFRSPQWNWKWDLSKNQDMLWIGAVNAGLRVKWKAENYVRPLVNIYYGFGPLKMPPSWGNGGKGGVNVLEKERHVEVKAYSGSRVMNAGEQLHYDFELLITPFRQINNQCKYGDRYYHGGGKKTSVKIAQAKKEGANIINIHHAEDIYPFINYPYLDENVSELASLTQKAHEEDMRLKLYYTTRELTKNLPEFWAFNSLNGELIFPGPGNQSRTEALHPKGPNSWLIKNMREKYIPAWYNPIKEGKFKGELDISVITTPDSRLNNFYIAGLDWMLRNVGIDGVYIDDSALDRFTLRRARKLIDRYRSNGRVDLHSWNHFNDWAGYANCLNLYMDLLPYADMVWIGEGRDYDRSPDHWLVEVSGIPFGISGQMLQGGGNPWRGMVYGITNRAGWTANSPSEIWKFWDEYQIENKTMRAYWEKDCPVKCSNPSIRATLYQGPDEAIVAVANWSEQDEDVSLVLDEAKLGMDLSSCKIVIPEIRDFQMEQKDVSLTDISIPGKKGFLIVLTQD